MGTLQSIFEFFGIACAACTFVIAPLMHKFGWDETPKGKAALALMNDAVSAYNHIKTAPSSEAK